MKKKVRVYGDGAQINYCLGGAKKQQGGEPSMTQDSKKDPVHQQKTSDFMGWLKGSNEKALFEQQVERQKEYAKLMITQRSPQIPNVIQAAQNGASLSPGATVEDYGFKTDPNLQFFARDYMKDERQRGEFMTSIDQAGKAFGSVLKQPDVWNYKGDKKELFDQLEQDGYDTPQLTGLNITGREASGKRGRDRTLSYEAFGTQRMSNSEAPETPIQFTPTTDYQGFPEQTATMPTEGLVDPQPQGFDYSWPSQNEDLFRLMGEHAPKAQQGQNIPGWSLWDGAMFNDYYGGPPNPDGYQPTMIENDGPFFTGEGLKPDPNAIAVGEEPYTPDIPDDPFPAGDREVAQTGSIELEKQNKLKTMMQRDPLGMYQGFNAGINALSYLAEGDERASREKKLRERLSDVHRFYTPQGADRGDYMVNTPGVGDFLKPDQHTRMGYDTKVAQDGGSMEIGQEVALSNDEIERLIAQGYQLEYLD